MNDQSIKKFRFGSPFETKATVKSIPEEKGSPSFVDITADGKTIFYSLADDHVATLLRQGTEHIREDG